MKTIYNLLEKNYIPHFLIRNGIRKFLKTRIQEQNQITEEQKNNFIENLKKSKIAIDTQTANEQHYEVPSEFFKIVLGKHLKYSCGYWPQNTDSLTASEENMLNLYCERADLKDGQEILDLGCGWGSLSLYLAKRFPNSKITAVSNSSTQKSYIDSESKAHNLNNLKVLTCDINQLSLDNEFDRILSIEMFEHMRNYEELLKRIATWLNGDGKLFAHIFCHKTFAYPFEVKGDSDWMAKNFFTGGIMPSQNLFSHFQKDLKLVQSWQIDGTHYQKTSEAWLKKTIQNKKNILKLFEKDLSKSEALKKYCHWKVFFMACAETFGFNAGKEWFVSHYCFENK